MYKIDRREGGGLGEGVQKSFSRNIPKYWKKRKISNTTEIYRSP